MRFVARFSGALVAGLALTCLLYGCASSPKAERKAPVKAEKARKAAPEFALKDADGRTVRLADYKGKVILLDFWATWCGPCKIEIPWFVEFERKHKDRGFAVIGVSMDEEGWEIVKPFTSKMGVNYRMLLGDDSTAQLYGGVEALPTTFLIDREGRVAAVHVGLASKSDFENGIEHLLQAPASAARASVGESAGAN
jgi:peroxiredoxin